MTDKEILEWLRGKCTPGECGCMIWKAGCSTTRNHALPTVRHPVNQRNMPARRVLLAAMGVNIRRKCATSSCGDPMCMAEAHAQAISRKELQVRNGHKIQGNRVRNAKLAKAAQRQSQLTMELVREMRSSGMTATQAAKHYGMPFQGVARALAGRTFRDYSSDPFAGLGAR